jgi:hypothetical protein
MLKKKLFALALGASILAPQIAIASASAASCKCVTKHVQRRVIRHAKAKTKTRTVTKVVYRDRVITQPVVVNHYSSVTPAPEPVIDRVVEQPVVVPRVVEQPVVVPRVIEQPVVVPRINRFSAVIDQPPVFGPRFYPRPGFRRPFVNAPLHNRFGIGARARFNAGFRNPWF